MDPVRRERVAGIVLMLVATGCFAAMHATMKGLTPHYPPMQLAALRGLASLPLILGWILLRGEFARVPQVRWPLQLLRGGFALLTVGMAIHALKWLPLADAYAISFAAPLVVAALAVPLLGERVDARQWTVILLGFAGVLIVLRPGGTGMLTWAGLMMLLSAIGYAAQALTVRALTRTDSTPNTVLWMTVFVALGAGLLALPGWTPLAGRHLPAVALVAVAGVFGQFAVTEALRRAPASVIAPFEYSALLWALLLDWALWSKGPDRVVLAGASLIIASGLYLIRRRPDPETADGGAPDFPSPA